MNFFLNSKNYINYLIFIIPALLSTGSFLPDFVTSLLALYYLIYYNFKNNILNYKSSYLYFLFLIYLIVNSFFAIDIYLSLKASLFYLRFILLSLFIFSFFELNYKNIKIFFYFFIITFFFICIDSIFQKIYGYNFFGIKLASDIRLSGIFGTELILGSYLSRLSYFLLFFIYFYRENKKIKLITFIVHFLGFIVTIMTAEKNSIAIYLLSFVILLIFYKENIIKKIILIILIFGTMISTLHYNPNIKKRVIDNFKNTISSSNYFIPNTHIEHYKTAFKMFKERPVFGHGLKSFRVKCKLEKFNSGPNSCSTHPHNIVLQFLSELGIVGLLFYILAFFYFLINFLKILYLNFVNEINFRQILYAPFLFNILVSINPILPSGNIFHNWLNVIFYYNLGFFFLFKFKYKL